MSDTYRDQIRTALAQTDSGWGEATGDGDAIPAYIDTLTESVAFLRDDELAERTRERDAALVARDQWIDATREARAEAVRVMEHGEKTAANLRAELVRVKSELADANAPSRDMESLLNDIGDTPTSARVVIEAHGNRYNVASVVAHSAVAIAGALYSVASEIAEEANRG